ncbi:U-scoloptoxin(05)-Sm1a [Achroia grisella]|uniref:U-scoloptoxin(05)-Sm1a n=1 Tax=Achroia grisella TaxID=688607 RepID=UPI0027D25093|nr:U-scoloptoxin(05)-Sm1a [Achroia grisella]
MANTNTYSAVVLLCFGLLKTVNCISCYQCSGTDSTNPFECNEFLDNDIDMMAISCNNIHDANYCIKHVGRNEGGISTKRFCSSLDLGNYCNYVREPGDKLEYRTCIYTCNSDGCNMASAMGVSTILLMLCLYLTKYVTL